LGDLFFQIGTIPLPNSQYQDVIFFGNMKSPEQLEILLKPDFQTEFFDRDIGIGAIGEFQAFEAANGDIMLALTYSEPTATNKEDISIALWNTNTEQWMYEKISFMNYFSTANIHLKGDKLYCYNSLKISCYNLNDGSLIWEKESESYPLEVQLLEEFIIVNNENLELLNYSNGEIIKVYQGTVFDFAASSKYIYIPSDELMIFDIEASKIIKTVVTPYLTYPDETPEYFKHLRAFEVVEDKENGVDYIFMSLHGYNFKMKMEY